MPPTYRPTTFLPEVDSTPVWYGIMFTDSSMTVKRYFDYKDLQEAESSDFVMHITRLFNANGRDEALIRGRALIKVLTG